MISERKKLHAAKHGEKAIVVDPSFYPFRKIEDFFKMIQSSDLGTPSSPKSPRAMRSA